MTHPNESNANDITRVVFRWWEGSVIALFPDHRENNGCCSSYQHVGQHGAADPYHIVRSSRPATEAEYSALKRELESTPYFYRFKVCKRLPRR